MFRNFRSFFWRTTTETPAPENSEKDDKIQDDKTDENSEVGSTSPPKVKQRKRKYDDSEGDVAGPPAKRVKRSSDSSINVTKSKKDPLRLERKKPSVLPVQSLEEPSSSGQIGRTYCKKPRRAPPKKPSLESIVSSTLDETDFYPIGSVPEHNEHFVDTEEFINLPTTTVHTGTARYSKKNPRKRKSRAGRGKITRRRKTKE